MLFLVGGAAVSLYAEREATESRATEDIDIVVEITTRTKYYELEEKLKQKGFAPDPDADFIARFKLPGIILDLGEPNLVVDVMPTGKDVFGSTNIWYEDGFKTAVSIKIDELEPVKIFSAPYFIASKIEAFKSRGQNDGRISQDFEDIIYVLENRENIWLEMKQSPSHLKSYLQKEFKNLRDNTYIVEWIDYHGSQFSPPSSFLILEDIDNFIS